MATTFDKVEDMALVVVDDYKLTKLLNQSVEDFQTYCDGFLLKSVPEFWQCNQSLSYDEEEREFDNDLEPMEISILAKLWVIMWWEHEMNDSKAIAQKLKVSSSFQFDGVSSQNFKEKQNVIDKLREDLSRQITNYQLQGLDSYGY